MTIKAKLIGSGMNWLQAQMNVGTVIATESAAGSNQAGATLMSMDDIHWVKTGGSNAGMILPPGNGTGDSLTAGDCVYVFANTGNTLKVYPPGTGAINGGSGGAAVSLTDKQKGEFICLDGGANANFIAFIS